jgi:hypothetical protein
MISEFLEDKLKLPPVEDLVMSGEVGFEEIRCYVEFINRKLEPWMVFPMDGNTLMEKPQTKLENSFQEYEEKYIDAMDKRYFVLEPDRFHSLFDEFSELKIKSLGSLLITKRLKDEIIKVVAEAKAS